MGRPPGFWSTSARTPEAARCRAGARLREIEQFLPREQLERQAARCMDCGIPYCTPTAARSTPRPRLERHGLPQPVAPRPRSAPRDQHLPEVTGRICPAPASRVHPRPQRPPVGIRQIELQIVERGWREGWIRPQRPRARAASGSASLARPAGLGRRSSSPAPGTRWLSTRRPTAWAGSSATGSRLQTGEVVLDRRLEQLAAEESSSRRGSRPAGRLGQLPAPDLRRGRDRRRVARARDVRLPDASSAASTPRWTTSPSRTAASPASRSPPGPRSAPRAHRGRGRRRRHRGGLRRDRPASGGSRITQIEILPSRHGSAPRKIPGRTGPDLRSGSSHEEGCTRLWSVLTKELAGAEGQVEALRCVKVEWSGPDAAGRRSFKELPARPSSSRRAS